VVTMVWVVSRIRFKVETSLRGAIHQSTVDWIHDRDLLAWGELTTRESAHQLIEYPSTLIADYGREKKNVRTDTQQDVFDQNKFS